jgi:type II secretion system protein L
MAKRIFALDFHNGIIDWVLMRSGLRNATIEKAGRLACRTDGEIDPAAIAALKALRDDNDTTGLTCIAAIDSRGLLARSLTVPFRDKRKVRQILPLELEATLPVPVDELCLDFQLAGREDTQTALAVAMPKAQVAAHLQLLREAGLDPMLLTFAGLPAAALLAAGPHGKEISLLIDGDGHHGTLFWIGDHQILFIRSWTPPDAAADPVDLLQRAIAHTLEAVAQVLPAHAEFRTLYLTPPAARIYAAERLSAAFDCPVVPFDVAQSIRTPLAGVATQELDQGALALGLYESLAEKGLNLFRATFPLKRFLQQNRKRFIQTGVLAAVLTILFMTDVYLDIRHYEKRADFLQNEAAAVLKRTFPETRNIVNPLQQMIVKLREARADELGSANGPRVTQVDLLNTISRALPPKLDIHVSQLVSGAARVQISGTTGTFEAVNEANGLLEKTNLFDKITIVSASMDQKANRVRFKLAADLHDPLADTADQSKPLDQQAAD